MLKKKKSLNFFKKESIERSLNGESLGVIVVGLGLNIQE